MVLLIVTGLILLVRWRHGGFDWALFTSTLLGVLWPWLLAAAAINLVAYYVRALRWAVLIRHLRPDPGLWGLFSATAIGFTALVLLGRPGELVRPYLIAVKEKLSFSSQLAAWLLERICDMLCALLIFAIALTQVDRSGVAVSPGLRWVFEVGGYVAVLTAGVSIAVAVVLRQFSQKMQKRLLDALAFLPERWRKKVEELVEAFVSGMEATRRSAGLRGILSYTLFEWVLIVLTYVALFRAFPALAQLKLTDVVILLGFVAFGSLIQIPGIGGGVQVVSIVVFTEILKIPLEAASGIALVIWIVTFVVIVPIGLFLSIQEGFNWQRVKEMNRGSLP